MSRYYILDDEKHVVPVNDIDDWTEMFKSSSRFVGRAEIGDVTVSTVFLGLDHQYGEGPPLLFETMIFGGPLDKSMWRYSSWDDAETGHKAAVRKVRKIPL